MKRIIPIICLAFFALFSYICVASAEESFDYRNNTQMFCDKIAELNIELDSAKSSQGLRRVQRTMVLFQTKTVPLDFEGASFSPISVVYGPRGFSVLMCTDPDTAIAWLLKQDGVLYAEIDSEVSGCSEEEEEEEPSISFQSWGAEAAGFGEYSIYAQKWGSGSCTIAVVDSGVYRHSLINPKIGSLGHDYIDNDDDPTNDLHGHGTRVAGIVADCTRELPVYIFPIRVLDADANGKTSNVISAVLESIDANVDIINLSLATFSQSELLESAIRDAISAGIIVVAAAGNYACDASEVTPACMTDAGIIVVGSAEADGSRSSFSNYGASVDLYFYGRSISSCSRSGGYVADSGTSMAAPHISALCAMMQLIHPSISAGSMVSRMQITSNGNLIIPIASSMVPQSLGFHIDSISFRTGDILNMPLQAIPEISQESIHYETSNESIVSTTDGVLTANNAGTAEILVTCKGFETKSIIITVYDGDGSCIVLPTGIQEIGDEAFYGVSTDHVIIHANARSIGNNSFDDGSIWFITIPETIDTIGENTFSGAIVLCTNESAAQTYAMEHQLQYLTIAN